MAVCAEACPMGARCAAAAGGSNEGMCVCSADKPDVCMAMCVSWQNDPAYCGNCETACDPGAACAAGVCTATPMVLATLTGCGELRMALAGTDFYLADKTNGTVHSVPLLGGAATEVATGQMMPSSIVGDATAVYWANEGDLTIMRKLLPDGEPEVLYTAAAAEPVRGLALNADTLFFSSGTSVYAWPTADALPAVPQTIFVETDADTPGGVPAALAASATHVAWVSDLRQAVESTSVTGDAYFELGDSQGSLLMTAAQVDATHAYWATGDRIARGVLGMERMGNTVSNTLDFSTITGFVASATHIYFGAGTADVPGLIHKAELGENVKALPIARDQVSPSSLLVDGANLYWVTGDCNVVSTPL